jgi:hypothetical protein
MNVMDNVTVFEKQGDLPFLVDLPVLINFWKRPQIFEKTLLAVMSSRPSEIYLYQNAPSPNFSADDKRKYDESLSVALRLIERIDWQCRVYLWKPTDYCDIWYSIYRADKWGFSMCRDACACLDDDCTPSKTWLLFAKTLLDKYRGNPQISYVYCEINCEILKPYSSKWDYMFSHTGSSHGWATWKSVFFGWDQTYSWLNDPEAIKALEEDFGKKITKSILEHASSFHSQNDKPQIEIYMGCYRAIHHMVNILPTRNMLINNGSSGENNGTGEFLSRKMRKYYAKKAYDVTFPLKGPDTIFIDPKIDRRINQAITSTVWSRIEIGLLYLFHGKLFSHLKSKKKKAPRK